MKQQIERVKNIPHRYFVAAFGTVSKVVIALVQLLSIPILYKALGLESFAVFTVITGLISWYALMDFGLGSVLQNWISEYRATGQDASILLQKVSILIIIIMLIAPCFASFCATLLQPWLFANLGNQLSISLFIIVLTLYFWWAILQVASRVFFALHIGEFGYFYQILAYLFILFFLIGVYCFDWKIDLNTSLVIWSFSLFLFSLIGYIHAFKLSNISTPHFDFVFYKTLFKKAWPYWLFAISSNGVLAIDYIVIAKMLSATDIVIYNMLAKIFATIIMVYSTMLSALWPNLAEAFCNEEKAQAAFLIKKTIFSGVLYAISITALIIIFRDEIVGLFNLKKSIHLPMNLLLLFGFYGVIRVWTDTYAVVLQARNKMHVFMWIVPIQAIVAIISMILLSPYGLIGIMISLILSFLLTVTFVLPIVHYRY